MRHLISIDLSDESEAALRRATGQDPTAVVYESAIASVMTLVRKGEVGLEADRRQRAGEIGTGRGRDMWQDAPELRRA